MPTSRIDTGKVQLGLGILEIGAYVNGAFVAYRDMGAIKASANLHWMRETLTFETGRPLIVVKRDTIREHFTFDAELAELSVANIKDSLGLFTSNSSIIPTFMDGTSIAPAGDLTSSTAAVGVSDTLGFGGLCTVNNMALRFTHIIDCSTGRRIILEMYKASPTGDLAAPFQETAWTQYRVTWEALADTTRVAGTQYLQLIYERN